MTDIKVELLYWPERNRPHVWSLSCAYTFYKAHCLFISFHPSAYCLPHTTMHTVCSMSTSVAYSAVIAISGHKSITLDYDMINQMYSPTARQPYNVCVCLCVWLCIYIALQSPEYVGRYEYGSSSPSICHHRKFAIQRLNEVQLEVESKTRPNRGDRHKILSQPTHTHSAHREVKIGETIVQCTHLGGGGWKSIHRQFEISVLTAICFSAHSAHAYFGGAKRHVYTMDWAASFQRFSTRTFIYEHT